MPSAHGEYWPSDPGPPSLHTPFEVQKPQVTMFINRQNLNTDAGLVLKQSFIPKIVESVDKKVF